MNLNNNTILITGGSSGIGFELAKQLAGRNNTIIIAGRELDKLKEAQTKIPGLRTAVCDVADPQSIRDLQAHISKTCPTLNMLINCAGIMRKLNLHTVGADLEDATREISINLNGTIWTNLEFLPLLKAQPHAAIVNISSGLAFIPMPIAPVYCASKAAIHAFTQSLRVQLKDSTVRVFELAPPGTETPLFHGDFTKEDVGGAAPMPVAKLAELALAGLARDVEEIRPGLSNVLKIGSRVAPGFMLAQLGKSVDLMLAQQNKPAPAR
jgi:uncharacterized oxidoreductase